MKRAMLSVALVALFGTTVLLLDAGPVVGQKKSNEAALNQTIQRLQKDVQDRDNKINQLQQKIQQLETQPPKNGISAADADMLRKTIKKQTDDITGLKNTIVPLDALKRAKVVHTLQLKLKPEPEPKSKKKDDDDDAKDDEAKKLDELNKKRDAKVKTLLEKLPVELAKISGYRGMYLGKPRDMNSEIEFQLQANILIDDEATLVRFLDDPAFKKLGDTVLKDWEKPKTLTILVPQ